MSKRNLLTISIIVVAIAFAVAVNATFAAGDLTPKEARKLIARMAGINLPSDAVRVKEVSAMGNSATVVAQVETAFALTKGATANGGSPRFVPAIGAGKTSTCSSKPWTPKRLRAPAPSSNRLPPRLNLIGESTVFISNQKPKPR